MKSPPAATCISSQTTRHRATFIARLMFLLLLILANLAYLSFAIISVVREKRKTEGDLAGATGAFVPYMIGGAVPVGVAATMTYLFLIVGGSTTVQFNEGSPSAMNVWSTWVGLWPVLLFLTAANGGVIHIWLLVCLMKRNLRPLIPVAATTLVLSVLAFLSVFTFFPTD